MFGYIPTNMRNISLDLINSLKDNKYSYAISLIVNGIPLDTQDDEGKTALMIAILQHKNDIIDLILHSYNCTNKSLIMIDNLKDSALTLAIRIDSDTVVEKILKKFKYNLYQEIQQEITKCKTDITQLELEELGLSFNIEAAMNKLNVGENQIDLLKEQKAKLEEDLTVLNDGVSWLDDNMDKLGINDAIIVSKTLNKPFIERLLIRPSSEHVVLKRVSNIKKVFKKTSRPRSVDEKRRRDEEENMKNLIGQRSKEQKKKRETLSSSRRMGKRDSDDSDMDGRRRKIRRTKSRRRRSKSRRSKTKIRRSKKKRRRSRSKSKRRRSKTN